MGYISDLRKQAQRRTSNVYDTLFTRRVSIYFTAVLNRLGFAPNTVSLIGVLVGLTACGLIAFGTGAALVTGVGLVHLYAVLDSVDGELARLQKSFSLKGLFLEDLSGYTMINAFQLGVAFYLWRTTGLEWPLFVAVAMVAFFRNAMPVARRALLKSVQTKRPTKEPIGVGDNSGDASAPSLASRIRAVIEDHILHFTYIWIVTSTLVLVEELGGYGHLHLVLYAFAFYSAALMLKEIAVVVLFMATGLLERELGKIYTAAADVPTAQGSVNGLALTGDRQLS